MLHSRDELDSLLKQAFAEGDGANGYPRGAHYRNCWWVTDPDLPMFSAAGIHGNVCIATAAAAKLGQWRDAAGILRTD